MEEISRLAHLIKERNLLEVQISQITGRPASLGHLGEFIASRIFGIRLAHSATMRSIDGWFEAGPLAGKSVNVKRYPKNEGVLDMCLEMGPDYYLVLAGPQTPPVRSVGPRPWLIESVYLFEEVTLRPLISAKVGIAASVRREVWKSHEIYPTSNPALMELTDSQLAALRLFGAPKG